MAKHYTSMNKLMALKPCADGRRRIRYQCKLRGYGPDTPVPVSEALEGLALYDIAYVLASLDDKAQPALRRAVIAALRADIDVLEFSHCVNDADFAKLQRGDLQYCWNVVECLCCNQPACEDKLFVTAIGALLVHGDNADRRVSSLTRLLEALSIGAAEVLLVAIKKHLG